MQVRELMLLTQRQADVIEELQLKLACRAGSPAAHGGARRGVPAEAEASCFTHAATSSSKGRGSADAAGGAHDAARAEVGDGGVGAGSASKGAGDGAGHAARAQAAQQELQAQALEITKLTSVNAELVQNLDSMTLMFSGVSMCTWVRGGEGVGDQGRVSVYVCAYACVCVCQRYMCPAVCQAWLERCSCPCVPSLRCPFCSQGVQACVFLGKESDAAERAHAPLPCPSTVCSPLYEEEAWARPDLATARLTRKTLSSHPQGRMQRPSPALWKALWVPGDRSA